MAPRPVVFTVPTNGLKWLNANDRHRSVFAKHELKKEWRFMASVYARSNGVPHFLRAKVMVIVHRAFDGPADVLNWADTVKPVIDGFTDAKVWPDDDNDHIVVDIRAGEPWKKPGLEIIIVPAGWDRDLQHFTEADFPRLKGLRARKLAYRKQRKDAMLELFKQCETDPED